MSGKHYKGPEVSCCIKYFIFGFNVIFWVSWSFWDFNCRGQSIRDDSPRVVSCLYFSQPLGRVPEQGEAFAFSFSSLRVGEETFNPF